MKFRIILRDIDSHVLALDINADDVNHAKRKARMLADILRPDAVQTVQLFKTKIGKYNPPEYFPVIDLVVETEV